MKLQMDIFKDHKYEGEKVSLQRFMCVKINAQVRKKKKKNYPFQNKEHLIFPFLPFSSFFTEIVFHKFVKLVNSILLKRAHSIRGGKSRAWEHTIGMCVAHSDMKFI